MSDKPDETPTLLPTEDITLTAAGGSGDYEWMVTTDPSGTFGTWVEQPTFDFVAPDTGPFVSQLAESARKNVEKAGYINRITVICGDGSEGYAEKAPYDRILVTAAAPDVPKPLVEQLKTGGVLVIPVGSLYMYQTLMRIRKKDNQITEENLGGVAFVPLVGKHGHKLRR